MMIDDQWSAYAAKDQHQQWYPIAKDGEGHKGNAELKLISNIADFLTGKSDYFDMKE